MSLERLLPLLELEHAYAAYVTHHLSRLDPSRPSTEDGARDSSETIRDSFKVDFSQYTALMKIMANDEPASSKLVQMGQVLRPND